MCVSITEIMNIYMEGIKCLPKDFDPNINTIEDLLKIFFKRVRLSKFTKYNI